VNAWLVTWEWMGAHAAVESPLIAILSGRLGYSRVAEFVKWTWASAMLTPEEWLDGVRHRRLAYEPESGRIGTIPWSGEMSCGHNPFVWARLVRNARVEGNGVDRELHWERWVLSPEVYERYGADPPEPASFRMPLS
jgi:hypothetical protein